MATAQRKPRVEPPFFLWPQSVMPEGAVRSAGVLSPAAPQIAKINALASTGVIVGGSPAAESLPVVGVGAATLNGEVGLT